MSARPAMTPHLVVVLGIDPGETSGWSIWERGEYIASGEARIPVERESAIRAAQRHAEAAARHLVVVAEQWMPVAKGKWTPRTIAGTGAQWGRWAEQLEIAGVKPRQIVRVEPNEWRAATLGRRRLDRDGWKRLAMTVAPGYTKRPVGADEAEAVLIGCWGARAAVVGEAMPKRPRRVA